ATRRDVPIETKKASQQKGRLNRPLRNLLAQWGTGITLSNYLAGSFRGSLALRESRTHGGNYRFLSIWCDCNCDHFHRLPLSVGPFKGRGGLGRPAWYRAAFASVSIRERHS